MPTDTSRWSVLLPLKGGPTAKSRLRAAPVPDAAPDPLAAAIAADCLSAVLACRSVASVLVVTGDGPTAAAAAGAGARVVPERRAGAGLLAAIADGLAAVPGGLTAVLLGDLPALRPGELATALGAARRLLRERAAPMVAVPDADQLGTVLLAARRPAGLRPAFGPGSYAEHLRRGAAPLPLDLPGLRRDVDTPADLAAALVLGCGPRTTALATEIALSTDRAT